MTSSKQRPLFPETSLAFAHSSSSSKRTRSVPAKWTISPTVRPFVISPSMASMYEGEAPSICVPWSQLRSFKNSVSTRMGRRSLTQSSEDGEKAPTVECLVKAHHFAFVQKGVPKRLHSQISALTLGAACTPQLLGWLSDDSFTLPRVTDLELNFFVAPINSHLGLRMTQVLSFVRRSVCSLKRLRVDYALCEPGVISEILSLCDGIQELALPIISSQDLKALTLNPQASVLAPRLQELKILVPYWMELDYSEFPFPFDGVSLTEMAMSRDSGAQSRGHHQDVPRLAVIISSSGSTRRNIFHSLGDNGHSPERSSVVTRLRPDADRMIAQWEETLLRGCDSRCTSKWEHLTLWPNPHPALDAVLEEMESYPIGLLDAMLLQKYSIPSILEHGDLILSAAISDTCDGRYKVKARLKAIRDKWNSTIVSEVASYQRWMLRGRFELEYLPFQDHRRSGDGPWMIAAP